MVNDPELKAMSEVFDALQNLDASTQKRVVDWVMAKLNSSPAASFFPGARRGPKPGSKRVGKKRGRKPRTDSSSSSESNVVAKRGPKPGSKRTGKKRGPKKGKGGRPPGSKNASTKKPAAKSTGRRGRPSKSSLSSPST